MAHTEVIVNPDGTTELANQRISQGDDHAVDLTKVRRQRVVHRSSGQHAKLATSASQALLETRTKSTSSRDALVSGRKRKRSVASKPPTETAHVVEAASVVGSKRVQEALINHDLEGALTSTSSSEHLTMRRHILPSVNDSSLSVLLDEQGAQRWLSILGGDVAQNPVVGTAATSPMRPFFGAALLSGLQVKESSDVVVIPLIIIAFCLVTLGLLLLALLHHRNRESSGGMTGPGGHRRRSRLQYDNQGGSAGDSDRSEERRDLGRQSLAGADETRHTMPAASEERSELERAAY